MVLGRTGKTSARIDSVNDGIGRVIAFVGGLAIGFVAGAGWMAVQVDGDRP